MPVVLHDFAKRPGKKSGIKWTKILLKTLNKSFPGDELTV